MPRGQWSCRAFVLASALFVLCVGGAQASPPDAQPLEVGKPIERELRPDEVDLYSFHAAKGQYFKLVIEQWQIDVAVRLTGPDGVALGDFDSKDNTQRPEKVLLVAPASGEYAVAIRAVRKGAKGRYGIRLEGLHDATSEDQRRIEAAQAIAEGDRLSSSGEGAGIKQAIPKFESAAALSQQIHDLEGEGDALLDIAEAYSVLSENDKAFDALGRALTAFKAVPSPRGEAETLNTFGETYFNVGQLPKALDMYLEALTLWRSTGYRAGLALTLNNAGLVHYLWADKEKAIEYYSEAAPLWADLGDRGGEALTLSSIGAARMDQGENQKALDAFMRSRTLLHEVGQVRGEASIVTNISLVYESLGDFSEALRYALEAIPLREKAGDPRGLAYTLTSVGKAYADLGEYTKAEESYTRALSLSRSVKDPKGEATALTRLGSLYETLGDKEKALQHQNQALEIRRHQGDPAAVSAILLRVGPVYESLGQREKALEGYREALGLGRAATDPYMESDALTRIAEAERVKGQLTEARKDIEDAIRLVESLRNRVGSLDLRASYLALERQPFEVQANVLMDLHRASPGQGYDALALESIERSRARSLLELLAEAGGKIRQGVDPNLLERERSVQRALQSKVDRQTRLLAGKHSNEEAAALAKEVDALTGEYAQIQAQIRVTSPRYAALVQPQTLKASEIQGQLRPGDTLLEYFLGEERSFLWVVTSNGVTSFELPRRSEIEAAARLVYDELRTAPGTAVAVNKYWSDAARLSAMILGSVRDLPQDGRLMLVPDGALEFVPFAALPHAGVGQKELGAKPLGADQELVYLASASTLGVLRQGREGRRLAAKTLAVLADPVFEKDDERVSKRAVPASNSQPADVIAAANPGVTRDLQRSAKDLGISESARGISRLPFTRREANAIASLVPTSMRKEALDFDASRATATNADLSHYRYVHFATHGFLDNAHPELSGIVLSLVDRQGREQPGFLSAFEVFNLNLPADVVVLSACRTALGKDVRGEGLVGLTRAFMYAGAARVVASLWTVDDVATAELMKRFYEGMLGPAKLDPPAALRAAQLAVGKTKRWEHPYYWASFVIQGD
jgi:CHAT domain-containing protein/tetratricopeptide (TPR) repeat protein